MCEGLVAVATQKWSLASVLSEMVPQIAAFLEDTTAVRVHALEIELNSLCLRVSNLDRLVPV